MRTDHMVVRLPPEEIAEAIREPHVHEFGRPGAKPMKGFVIARARGLDRRRRARRMGRAWSGAGDWGAAGQVVAPGRATAPSLAARPVADGVRTRR